MGESPDLEVKYIFYIGVIQFIYMYKDKKLKSTYFTYLGLSVFVLIPIYLQSLETKAIKKCAQELNVSADKYINNNDENGNLEKYYFFFS